MILTKAFNTGGRITLDILLQPTLFLSGSFSVHRKFSFGCTAVDIPALYLLLYDVPFVCVPPMCAIQRLRVKGSVREGLSTCPAQHLFFRRHPQAPRVKDEVAGVWLFGGQVGSLYSVFRCTVWLLFCCGCQSDSFRPLVRGGTKKTVRRAAATEPWGQTVSAFMSDLSLTGRELLTSCLSLNKSGLKWSCDQTGKQSVPGLSPSLWENGLDTIFLGPLVCS